MKRSLLEMPVNRETAAKLLHEAARLARADAKEVGSALARDLDTGVRRVLNDCVVASEARARHAAPDLELDDPTVTEPPIDEKPAPAPEPRSPRSQRRAAVRLVTQIEARARARGFDVEQSPARADHAITLSLRGEMFCTVSALAGEVFADEVGPAPCQRVTLAWDPDAEIHFAPLDAACPDPVHAIEVEIAMLLRAILARRVNECKPVETAC